MELRNEVKKIKLTSLYLVHNASTTYLIKRPVSIYSRAASRLDVSCIRRCCFADPGSNDTSSWLSVVANQSDFWPLTLPRTFRSVFWETTLRRPWWWAVVLVVGVVDAFFDLIIFTLFTCVNAQTADLWLAGLQGLYWSWIHSHWCTMVLWKNEIKRLFNFSI